MKKNEKITSRDVDFAKWYTDIVNEAHLACYSKVKGCIVIEPNGYAIWERMQEELDKMFIEASLAKTNEKTATITTPTDDNVEIL